jgi:hypothetical protein
LRGQRRILTGFPILRLPSRRHLEIDAIIAAALLAALLQCDIRFEIGDSEDNASAAGHACRNID